MSDKDYLVQQLAYQILHTKWDSDGNPLAAPASGIEQVGTGEVRLDLEIRGIVHNLRRQIWVDQGAWTAKILAEIEHQAAALDVNKLITDRVKAELESCMRRIEEMTRESVADFVQAAVYDRIGDLPRQVAQKTAERLVAEIVK